MVASPTRFERLRLQASLIVGGAYTALRKRAQPLESWASAWFGGGRGRRIRHRDTYGSPGTAIYHGYVHDGEVDASLIGSEKYRTYSRILANTSIVSGSVRYFLNLCAQATWTFQPAQHARGEEYATAIEAMLTEDPDTPWGRIVRRAAMYRFYGYSVQEWTARRRADGVITLSDVAPRPQATIERWDANTDGSIEGIVQRSPQDQQEHYLPRKKCVYLVDDSMNDSPEGLGLFRHIVGAATRLERFEQLEGFGFETDLRGIPVGKAPYGELREAVESDRMTASQAQDAVSPVESFVKNHVRTPQIGLLLDSSVYATDDDAATPTPNPKYSMDLLDGGSSSLPDMAKTIERLTREIARVLGTEVLLLGESAQGSFALSQNKTQQLSMQVDATLTDLAQAFRRDLIKPLFLLNGWPLEAMPTLVPEAAQYRDPEQLAGVLQMLAAAGAMLDPVDPAIAEVRALAGLSAPDTEHMDIDLVLGEPKPPSAAAAADDNDDNEEML